MVYLLLVGPFFFWLFIAWREYREFLYREIFRFKYRVLISVFLLAIHTVLLVAVGPEWFCAKGAMGRGEVAAFFFPGVGYALLSLPFVINGSVFSSSRERLQEIATSITGAILILYGYFYVFVCRLAEL